MRDLEELARLVGVDEHVIAVANLYSSWSRTADDLDVWAFIHLRPVLLAAGCYIHDHEPIGVCVHWCVFEEIEGNGPATYATALANAVRWLAEHQPAALAEAVEKVRAK